jgi:hypothetical protein
MMQTYIILMRWLYILCMLVLIDFCHGCHRTHETRPFPLQQHTVPILMAENGRAHRFHGLHETGVHLHIVHFTCCCQWFHVFSDFSV